MESSGRLNRVISLWEAGQVAFGSFVPAGSIDAAVAAGESPFDFCILEMEHSNFDFPGLRLSLQFMLNRRHILEGGSLAPSVVPLTRIPANAREGNQWLIKQSLDYGVYGIVSPHLNRPEEAVALLRACRYPQRRGAPDVAPEGLRGTAPANALRYWGLSYPEYFEKADVWPLDPGGELVLMPLIEEAEGVRNIGDILRQAKGLSAIFIGEVDLSVSLGRPMELGHPDVVEAMGRVLTACKAAGVPCGCLAAADNVEERIEQGYRFIVVRGDRAQETLERARRAAARAK
ncbi:MAG: aldolase [Chloroflexi bacterium]|nr:aldolase [Chloroflexota bacterium]